MYEQERRRSLEYSGLAGVAQAIGSGGQSRQLFERLVEAVAPLFDARIVGFLLLDEARGQLVGQVPFRGLPPHIVDIYRVRVVSGSPAEVADSITPADPDGKRRRGRGMGRFWA